MIFSKKPAEQFRARARPSPSFIPAKDEGQRIAQCLASDYSQDYPAFGVLAVDDRSTDATGKIMEPDGRRRSAAEGSAIEELPPGWTARTTPSTAPPRRRPASGSCFIDSDVILQPRHSPATLRVAKSRNYDMLSLILKQETRRIWDRH